MGFGTAFLGLCLLVSIQASSVYPVSPYEVKTLPEQQMAQLRLTGITSLPSPDWAVVAWVKVKPNTSSDVRFLQFRGFAGVVPVEC